MKESVRKKLSLHISQGIVHESGHLVAGLVLGLPITTFEFEVLASSRGDQFTFVGRVDKDQEQFARDIQDPGRRDGAILRRLAVTMAGPMASLEFYGPDDVFEGGQQDFNEHSAILHELVPESERDRIGNLSSQIAKRIIQQNRAAIETVARALFNRFNSGMNPARIEGAEIHKLLEASGNVPILPKRGLLDANLGCLEGPKEAKNFS